MRSNSMSARAVLLLASAIPFLAAWGCGGGGGGNDDTTTDPDTPSDTADTAVDTDATDATDASDPDVVEDEGADVPFDADAEDSVEEDVTTDTTDGDGPPPPDWSCLGSVIWGTPTLASLDILGTALDYVTGAPVAGATARACARTDAACATPLDEGTTDAAGQVTLTVPLGTTGFDGYFEVSMTGYVTTLRYTVEPITEMPPESGRMVQIVDLGTFALLAASLGVTPDPARGHLVINALDCTPFYAAGVSLAVDTADSGSTRIYMVGGLPSTTATETDASGAAGFVNLPTGPASVSTTLVSTSEAIGSTDIDIRAGAICIFAITPTP